MGGRSVLALHTPGHTEGSTTFVAGDLAGDAAVAFTGDFLFVDSIGRPDLAGKTEVLGRETCGGASSALASRVGFAGRQAAACALRAGEAETEPGPHGGPVRSAKPARRTRRFGSRTEGRIQGVDRIARLERLPKPIRTSKRSTWGLAVGHATASGCARGGEERVRGGMTVCPKRLLPFSRQISVYIVNHRRRRRRPNIAPVRRLSAKRSESAPTQERPSGDAPDGVPELGAGRKDRPFFVHVPLVPLLVFMLLSRHGVSRCHPKRFIGTQLALGTAIASHGARRPVTRSRRKATMEPQRASGSAERDSTTIAQAARTHGLHSRPEDAGRDAAECGRNRAGDPPPGPVSRCAGRPRARPSGSGDHRGPVDDSGASAAATGQGPRDHLRDANTGS